MARLSIVVAWITSTTAAFASPNIDLDDPVYEQLETLRALGRLPPFLGGFRPLTEARAHDLITLAREPADAFLDPPRWWASPLRTTTVRAAFAYDEPRDYSTPARPRDLTGSVSALCEHHEGRPCTDAFGLMTWLESAAGYDRSLSADVRLRALLGSDTQAVAIDRAYVNGELGPVAAEVGRDVLALGPSSRTQLGWGDHAPPLDHVRVSTAAPVPLGPVHASAQYVIGRLAAPQTYPGNLVTISRVQLDFADVEVGAIQLLQLGGEGAPSFGILDFVAEHVRRRDKSATASDSSNRRFGGDVSFRVAELAGARFYYQLIFEDIRRARLIDAIRYDADHLVGVELAAPTHELTVEWYQTGVRSHEHTPRVTGFTNRGFVVGAPLGPDATSVFAGGRIELGWSTLRPWLELARLASDTYELIAYGPINRLSRGVTETRYRGGARLRVPLQAGVSVEGEALYEHVDAFAFRPGDRRDHVGLGVTMVWHPSGPLGRLAAE